MDKTKFLKLAIIITICEIIGAIGSIFTIPNIPAWYNGLVKPFFNPPNFLFAPVWTILFLMLGIAIFIVLENKDKKLIAQRKIAKILFAIQYAFNVLWSYLFFGLRNPLLGFIGIVILWATIIATIFYFYKVDKRAAYLLIPYILWVSFAMILNFFVMILN
ncbi:MAG: tryptophan-rich sensory protein [Candidatus ainarchaeum sp.]|nr:tryptophan-rich sensory protein [Candidatus ainarchaeum sp.]